MTRSRPRHRSRSRRAGRGRWVLAVILLGHALMLGSLALIGPPPAVRVDALWVRGHQDLVRLAVAGVAIALLGTLPAPTAPHLRWPVTLLWGATGVAAVLLFDESIAIIARVLVDRVG